jgi:hypothetical protein
MVSLGSSPRKSLRLPRLAKAALVDGKSDGFTRIDHRHNTSTMRVQATR